MWPCLGPPFAAAATNIVITVETFAPSRAETRRVDLLDVSVSAVRASPPRRAESRVVTSRLGVSRDMARVCSHKICFFQRGPISTFSMSLERPKNPDDWSHWQLSTHHIIGLRERIKSHLLYVVSKGGLQYID